MKNIYRECGFLLAPKKSDTKHLEYTPVNTPIKFSNIICYSIEGNTSSPINVKNNFYVTTIINLPKKEFASKIRVEKDCMGKSVIVYPYENTAYFLFPRNQALINELVDIARAEKSWCPCIDNFDDTYMNVNGQPHQLVHLHMSFYYG